jgi:thiamine-phosphate pyrophosphorylase
MGTAFPRVHVVTDDLTMVRAAVAAAVDACATAELSIQVRVEDDITDRAAYELTLAVLELTRPAQVMCLVNDRLHVAVAADVDGGHVGADDLPVAAARQVLGVAGVLGATARDPGAARSAVRAGATYVGAGPYRDTATKTGLPPAIGLDGVRAVADAVPGTPVLAIGGITVADVDELAGVHGIAVVGAVARAAEPYRAAADLLAAVRRRPAEGRVTGVPA